MQRRSFMKLMATSAVGVGATAALSGCNIKGGSGNNIQPTLRFINLANNTPFTVQIQTAGTSNIVSSSFGTVNFASPTTHQSIDWESQYTITLYAVNTTGGTTTQGGQLLQFSANLQQNTAYTVIVYSAAGSLHAMINADVLPNGINNGEFIIQTLSTMSGLSSGATPTYDLYLTPANVGNVGDASDLSPLSASVTGAAIGQSTPVNAATQFTNGNYRLRLVKGGPGVNQRKALVFDAPSVTLNASAGNYMLLIYTTGSASLPTVMLIQPNTDTFQILNNPLARVRVVQGTPGVTSSQVTVGSATNTIGSFYFGAASNYYTVVAANAQVTFTNTSTVTTNATPYLTYSNSPSLPAASQITGGNDYCIYSVGSTTNASYLVIQDQNLPVNTDNECGLYFVNAVPPNDTNSAGLPTTSVDAYVSFARAASSLQSGTVTSAQYDVSPTQGQIGFNVANNGSQQLGQTITTGTTSVVTINNAPATISVPSLVTNGIFSVALVGAAGTYTPVIFQTNVF